MINTEQLSGISWEADLHSNGRFTLKCISKLEQNCTYVSRIYRVVDEKSGQSSMDWNMITDAILEYNSLIA